MGTAVTQPTLPPDAHPPIQEVGPVSAHSGRGLESILARLRQCRAQAPLQFRESELRRGQQTTGWSVLGDL